MTKQILTAVLVTVTVFNISYSQKISVSKGQKLESTVAMKMNMTIDMMGQSMENMFNTTTTSELEVKDTNDKGYLISNTIKRVVSTISAMGQDMNFDSDKKEDMEGQMGEAYKDQINQPKEILVGKDGKILEAPEPKDATGGMGSMMNIEVLGKGQTYPMLITLPTGGNLKIGDTWTDSSGNTDESRRVIQYTLKDIKGDDVVVSFTGNITRKGTLQQGGMDIIMDMAGTVTGESFYEKSSGWLKTNTADIDIKGTMEVMGQSAPLTIKSNLITTIKKL